MGGFSSDGVALEIKGGARMQKWSGAHVLAPSNASIQQVESFEPQCTEYAGGHPRWRGSFEGSLVQYARLFHVV